MRVLTGLTAMRRPPRRAEVTIGMFDGVHLAHQRLIRAAVRLAARRHGTSLALTFDPDPQRVLSPSKALPPLMPLAHRIELMRALGLDLIWVIPFTRRFSRMSPDVFAETVLAKRLGVRELWMGASARFGHRRRGTPRRMKALAARYGFRFGVVDLMGTGRHSISSTRVRRLVERGKLAEVRRLLGRCYDVLGRPVAGDARGRLLGFPTLNLDVASEVLPPSGVYAVWAELVDVREKTLTPGLSTFGAARVGARAAGVVNLGTRPTFYGTRGARVMELHLLNVTQAVRARTVRVLFMRKIRQERRFSSPQALVRQINKDVRLADTYLDGGPHATDERTQRVCR